MNCSEFKNSIKDYIEGRLSEGKRMEFKEHLLSCEHCRRDMGEVASILSEDRGDVQRDKRQNSILYFAIFVLFVLMVAVSVEFLRTEREDTGSLKPLGRKIELHSTGDNKEGNFDIKGATTLPGSIRDNVNIEKEDSPNTDVQEGVEEVEDFSRYSVSELKGRLRECLKTKDFKCISSAAMFLTKKTEGSERRGLRLMAIDALVEQGLCAAAMIHIMMLLKENPERNEVYRAHLLNARCYIKEKNFGDAEKIISMVEKEAPEFEDEIARLRMEIKKGEKDGK